MTDRITIIPQPIPPGRSQGAVRSKQPATGAGSFDQLLRNKIDQGG